MKFRLENTKLCVDKISVIWNLYHIGANNNMASRPDLKIRTRYTPHTHNKVFFGKALYPTEGFFFVRMDRDRKYGYDLKMTKIKKIIERFHSKASEKYIDVVFSYENGHVYEISVPTEYRRTGTLIEDQNIDEYLLKIYDEVDPNKWEAWKAEQKGFWEGKPGAGITKAFFDILSQSFNWCCISCTLPSNPNPARRIQDIKEFGYTLSTHTKKHCSQCKKNTTHLALVPIKRGGITGYETWSPYLRNKIVGLLKTFDAYEAKVTNKEGLLPDHKFPEIRWDMETRRHTLEDLSDDEIKNDFQLLSNQRNQQKREVCRNCFQTGNRGVIYGVQFFYEGGAVWDETIPKIGKEAEKGCRGCGWYDINKWRSELAKKLNSSSGSD